MKKTCLWMVSCLLLSGCSSSLNKPEATAKTDVSGPYINLTTYSFNTQVGEPLDFSNITAYDDVDGMVPVTLKGYVNYNQVGEYYPSLICRDTSGNETAVVITIAVLEKPVEASNNPSASNPPTPDATPSTCDASGAKDSSIPCDVVVPSEVAMYETIFEGKNGEQACQEAIGKLEEAVQASATCEVIQRNNGTFWGYGLKTNK